MQNKAIGKKISQLLCKSNLKLYKLNFLIVPMNFKRKLWKFRAKIEKKLLWMNIITLCKHIFFRNSIPKKYEIMWKMKRTFLTFKNKILIYKKVSFQKTRREMHFDLGQHWLNDVICSLKFKYYFFCFNFYSSKKHTEVLKK